MTFDDYPDADGIVLSERIHQNLLPSTKALPHKPILWAKTGSTQRPSAQSVRKLCVQ